MWVYWKASFCILLFSIAAISCVDGVNALGDEPNLHVYIPEELGPVAFGDPIFLPITVTNWTDKLLPGMRFDAHKMDISLTFTAGGAQQRHYMSQGSGFLGGMMLGMEPRMVHSTVILAPLWSPVFAKEALRTKRGRIEVVIGVVNSGLSSTVKLAPHVPQNAEVRLNFRDSAFTKEGHEAITSLATEQIEQLYGGDLSAEIYYTSNGDLSVFSRGTSPLSWRESEEGSEAQFDETSELFTSSSRMVRPDSRLARLIKMSVLLRSMRRLHPDEVGSMRQAWLERIDAFEQIYEQCDELERHFYTGHLALAWGSHRLVNGTWAEDWERVGETLRRQFPLHAGRFFEAGSMARTSLLKVENRSWLRLQNEDADTD